MNERPDAALLAAAASVADGERLDWERIRATGELDDDTLGRLAVSTR